MKNTNNFPFNKSRRITSDELQLAKRAIEKATGSKRRARAGRPPKMPDARHVSISIRLNPIVINNAKKEAEKRHVGYQTLINEILEAKLGH